MPRLKTIEPEHANAKIKKLYQEVEANLGMVPNLIKTLANSPVAAEAYMTFWNLMGEGVLPVHLKEHIALHVAEANGCSYCVSAHCAISKSVGLRDEEIQDGRQGTSPDRKTDAVLKFVGKVLETRGAVKTEDIQQLKDLGYADGEITEIIAIVVLTIFSNYFNNVAGTVNDFPSVPELANH